MKKIMCIVLVAIMLLFAVACGKNDNNNGALAPVYTAAPDAPNKQTGDNTSIVSLKDISERLGFKANTVIIRFSGLVDKNLTIEDIMTLEFHELSETGGENMPRFSGPLVKDVLELVGASSAATMTFRVGNSTPLTINLAELDLASSIFALKKEDTVFGLISSDNAYLIYSFLDGSQGAPTPVPYTVELG